MKQYEVEVMGKYFHGRYGKEHYFGMVLSCDSCKSAESFAEELVSVMTYEEFFDRCVNSFKSDLAKNQFMNIEKWTKLEDGKLKVSFYQRCLTDKIQDDHSFTFKARVFKG